MFLLYDGWATVSVGLGRANGGVGPGRGMWAASGIATDSGRVASPFSPPFNDSENKYFCEYQIEHTEIKQGQTGHRANQLKDKERDGNRNQTNK